MIGSGEAGSWRSCGAGDVLGVSVWEAGLERLRDDGLDGRDDGLDGRDDGLDGRDDGLDIRDDHGSELELSILSGESSGVNMAGVSSLADFGLYPTNCPEVLRRRGTRCR